MSLLLLFAGGEGAAPVVTEGGHVVLTFDPVGAVALTFGHAGSCALAIAGVGDVTLIIEEHG